MAITFVNATTQAIAASATVDITLPAGMQEGDYVFIGTGCDDTTGFLTFNTAGWTSIYKNILGGLVPSSEVRRKFMPASPDTVCNITNPAADEIAVVCQAWRGVDSVFPEDQVTVVSAEFAVIGMPDPRQITSRTDNALIVAFGVLQDEDATGVVAPTGYSNLSFTGAGGAANSTATAMVASKLKAIRGPEDPAPFTASVGNNEWTAATFALRPTVRVPTERPVVKIVVFFAAQDDGRFSDLDIRNWW